MAAMQDHSGSDSESVNTNIENHSHLIANLGE
ncbi:hypothetical protein AO9_03595 [Chlamydia psittaci Mat116]|nr:hypothetical protein AO9_03595 [Chlamydia psittaci Mat116]